MFPSLKKCFFPFCLCFTFSDVVVLSFSFVVAFFVPPNVGALKTLTHSHNFPWNHLRVIHQSNLIHPVLSSFSELCCLFCCPPCPSRIAAKLAFLPPEPTYALIDNEELKSKFQLQLNEKAEWPYSERDKDTIEAFYTRTSRGNKIACIFVKCASNARYTLLFSHGNAVDLGQMSSFYLGLGSRINCNIFRCGFLFAMLVTFIIIADYFLNSYDYSGYGASTGKPSEKNLYADIDAAWHLLRYLANLMKHNIL